MNESGEPAVANNTVSSNDASLMNGHTNCYVNQNNNDADNVGEIEKPPPTLIPQVFSSPGSEYWHARNPVADQVFITDVTVNLMTVTIRECKTEKGFFRNRDLPKQSDIK